MIKQWESEGKSQFEFKISNKTKPMDLFVLLKKNNYSPELEERNGDLYLVIDIRPEKKSKVIDLFGYKKQSRIKEIDDNVIHVAFGKAN